MHVHGGGGASFGRDAEANLVAATWHRSHGTDGLLASLVTLAPDDMLSAVRVLAEMTGAEGIAGIHLEGPWLSPQYAGAHDPRLLREPDLDELERLLDAGGGHIKMVTIAPELPGAISAIEMLSGGEWWPPWGIPTPPMSRHNRRFQQGQPWPPTCSMPCDRSITASLAPSRHFWRART